MMKNNLILTEIHESIATIWLNRPEKQNALTFEMITEFLDSWIALQKRSEIRMIIIRGKGPSFCSGADLAWMQSASQLSPDENEKECLLLAQCFYEIHQSRKISLCFTHGFSMGGANGFVAAADMVFAEEQTVFSFSEVLWGLIPATIAPYVVLKIGKAKAAEYMLTGKKISAEAAKESRLINDVIPAGMMEKSIEQIISQLLSGASEAQTILKSLIHELDEPVTPSWMSKTASILAQNRIGNEAREGINAFFEKRKPVWNSLKM
jgi:methylglutaconyl-CoA hydratase